MLESYQNSDRLETLKGRIKRCVCSSCGSKLGLKQIVFSEYEDSRCEIVCHQCDKLEYGVELEIYKAAKNFVEEFEVNHFSDLGENELIVQKNIAYISKIITWALKELGYITNNGFVVPPKGQSEIYSECIIISDEELNSIKEEEG